MTTGHAIAYRPPLLAVAAVCLCVLSVRLAAGTGDDAPPDLTITVEDGTYSVAARFDVPEAPAVALAVLSDYEQIPRFVPDVRTSVILERTPAHVIVEQVAVTRYLLFSKNIHLVLEITESGDTIRFTDRAHDSFTRYEGAWRVTPRIGDAPGAAVAYAVTAHPAFDVPEFILRKLLTRDSGEMIKGLRREIAARAAGRTI